MPPAVVRARPSPPPAPLPRCRGPAGGHQEPVEQRAGAAGRAPHAHPLPLGAEHRRRCVALGWAGLMDAAAALVERCAALALTVPPHLIALQAWAFWASSATGARLGSALSQLWGWLGAPARCPHVSGPVLAPRCRYEFPDTGSSYSMSGSHTGDFDWNGVEASNPSTVVWVSGVCKEGSGHRRRWAAHHLPPPAVAALLFNAAADSCRCLLPSPQDLIGFIHEVG